MGDNKFHIAQVWLKEPLTIQEILQKLSIEPVLTGSTNITGTRRGTKLHIRILSGSMNAVLQIDVFADRLDKGLRNVIQKALPVLTTEDLVLKGKAIFEKRREEEESIRWERAKKELMHGLFDLSKDPKFVQEVDRRIMREIGSPGYHSWAAMGRDAEDHVGALSRRYSYDIIKELAEAMAHSEEPNGDGSKEERGPQ